MARLHADPTEPRAVYWRHTCPSDGASRFDCAGVACLPAAQLGPAGLPTQARLRRQLLREGGGDVTRRRPGFGPAAGGGIGSEPEPDFSFAGVATSLLLRGVAARRDAGWGLGLAGEWLRLGGWQHRGARLSAGAKAAGDYRGDLVFAAAAFRR
jgi:hypothetical protein